MSSIPVPDEQTHYSSRRQDDVDALAWPVFSQRALDLLRSAGEVLHPEPGELLWDAGDPYDLYLVLAGGVLLLDRRNDRVVFVIEEGDFVGELGMLMGQPRAPLNERLTPRLVQVRTAASGCLSRTCSSMRRATCSSRFRHRRESAWQSYAEAHTADNMYPISTLEVAPVPVAPFSRVVELRAEPDQVWRTITDVKRLVEWVSILEDAEELEQLSRYRATLRDRLGPFKLRADLDITVSDVEEGRRIAGHAVGEDRQVGSRISVQADIHVEPSGDGTQLRVDGRYEVTGRIATLGTSMINNKAQKILDEFVERAEEELD